MSLNDTTSRDSNLTGAAPGQNTREVSRLFYRSVRSASTEPVLLIYRDSACKRQVGIVRRENSRLVFETRRDPAVHLCRKYGGWGIDVEVLHGLAAHGVEIIRIILPSEQCEQADMRTYLDCGHYANLGGGGQVFLSRRAFHNANQPTLGI